MKKLFVIILLVTTITTVKAQNKNAKLLMEVDGVCAMCKKRIEKAALNTKGVKFANWSIASHKLTLIVDERKTNAKKIKQNIVNVGHDTKELKASDAAYNAVHPCCKYRENSVIENHKKIEKK